MKVLLAIALLATTSAHAADNTTVMLLEHFSKPLTNKVGFAMKKGPFPTTDAEAIWLGRLQFCAINPFFKSGQVLKVAVRCSGQDKIILASSDATISAEEVPGLDTASTDDKTAMQVLDNTCMMDADPDPLPNGFFSLETVCVYGAHAWRVTTVVEPPTIYR